MKIKNLLRDNSGAGYVWMAILLVVILLFFGAIFNILVTSIGMHNIRTEIEAASDDLFADVREVSYGTLNGGRTGESFTSFSKNNIIESLGEHLNLSAVSGTNPSLSKYDNTGAWKYTISDVDLTYIDDTDLGINGTTYRSQPLGDLNVDGETDEKDLKLLRDKLDGKETNFLSFVLIDLNKDGEVNETDYAILEGLVEWWKTNDHKLTSAALLILTMKVRVPIKFGTADFGESEDYYSFITTMTVKPAEGF